MSVPSCATANPLQRKLSDFQSSESDNPGNRIAGESGNRTSSLGYNAAALKECSASCELLYYRRQQEIKYGEAAALLNYLQDQSRADLDSLFYHAVQLDAEDKDANVFWADAKMVVDLGQFGGVISFDISSMDNMSLWPFALFVGFNNYRESILLGMALMCGDTLESFQWLLFLNELLSSILVELFAEMGL